MPSMPLRSLPNRHYYDRDPTPDRPVVRLYPAISFLRSPPVWVSDDGEDTMDQHVVGPYTFGAASHRIGDDEFFGTCDVCKNRPAAAFDDFFGNMCPLCDIKHRLRYKALGVNPWTGAASVEVRPRR